MTTPQSRTPPEDTDMTTQPLRHLATRPLLLATLLTAACALTACVDAREADPASPGQWTVAEEEAPAPAPQVTDALPAHWTRHDGARPQLTLDADALRQTCGERAPLAPTRGDGPHAEPTLIETIGPDGCAIDRRSVRRAADGSPQLERYEIVDEAAVFSRATYITPFEYEHTWQTRELGQGVEVVQARRRLSDPGAFYTLTESFDAEGHLTERVQRGYDQWFPIDGAPQSTQRWVYQGDRLIAQEDWSGDRLLGETRTTLDAEGRPTRTERMQDGSTITTHTWSYEGATTIEESRDTSGAAFSRATHTLLADGTARRVTERLDTGWIEVATFDAEGRERQYQQDEDLDGRPELTRTTDYDAAGNKTFEGVAYDFDHANQPRRGSTERHTFDAQGRPLTSVRYGWPQHLLGDDPDLSRLPTLYMLTSRTDHEHSAAGHLTRERHTFLNPPRPGMLASYEQTARMETPDGRVLWERHDTDADGTPDHRREWRYDAAGRLVASQEFLSNSATPTNAWLTLRDAQGRPLAEITDQGADGTADATTLYRYAPVLP